MKQIQAYVSPDLQTVSSVRALETACKAHDQLSGSLFLDPSLNFSPSLPCLLTMTDDGELIGAMTFFAPADDEVEIVGLTHPNHRRKGVFRALTHAAAQIAKGNGIRDVLFVCEPKSESGLSALHAYGVQPDHVEYSLRYDGADTSKRLDIPAGLELRRAAISDLPDMARISAESFSEEAERAQHFLELAVNSKTRAQYVVLLNGEPVAICAAGYEDGEATIYGLGVLPRLQGKGIGRGAIALLLHEIFAHGEQDILIEVDRLNEGALHLYRSCGFAVEATYGYYRASVDRVLAHPA